MNISAKNSPDDDALARMRTELKELLSQSPGAREVLLHLASLERTLKVLGLGAFESLPSHVLKRIATQLDGVLPQPITPGLAEIQARIAKALALHEKAPPAATAVAKTSAPPAPYFSDDKLQVSEATHTEFQRVLEAQERKF
jgi:hypothetical protein